MKKNIVMDKGMLAQVIYFALEAIILAFVMLMNFAEASIDWARLLNGSFWFQYVVTLCLGVISFFLTVQGQKLKLKQSILIRGLTDQISAFYDYIASNDGLYTQMKKWIDEKNLEKKLNIYVRSLKCKREKTKDRKTIDMLDEKIANATNDIDFLEVKYTPKSINLLFEGFSMRDEDEMLHYKGNEQMAEYLLPAMAIGVFFTAFMLSFIISPAETTIDTIIQTATKVLSIGSYIWKGFGYADYSINSRFKATLESRKAIVQSFFDEIHYSVEIKDNPHYLFNVVKENNEEEKTDAIER